MVIMSCRTAYYVLSVDACLSMVPAFGQGYAARLSAAA
jgi:hypothetical protein